MYVLTCVSIALTCAALGCLTAAYRLRQQWTLHSCWRGFQLYTVQKHVYTNCDEGNGSFTLLHMRGARWILLTVPKWVLHFLSLLTFRGGHQIKIHNVLTISNKFTHCRDTELTGLSAPMCQGYHKTVCLRLTHWNATPSDCLAAL